MNKKDILQIKSFLGVCADTLISLFIHFCIDNKVAIAYFVITVIFMGIILYNCELYKIDKEGDDE